jgi:hypothetical protein
VSFVSLRSGPERDPEDVRDGRRQARRFDDDPLLLSHLETGFADRGAGIAGAVAAPGEVRVHRRVERALDARRRRLARDHVLVEAKFATGPENATDLALGGVLIRNRAEHERDDRRIEGAVLGGQRLGRAVQYLDRHAGAPGCLQREPAQVWLGLDRDHFGDAGRVVLEVQAVACADLDHPPLEAGEQPAAVLGPAAALGATAEPRVEPREHGVAPMSVSSCLPDAQIVRFAQRGGANRRGHMVESEDGLGLAEAIEAVREELRKAQDLGSQGELRFTVGEVEVELAVDVTKTAGGEASVRVLGVGLGGKGERSWSQTHRVRVSLNPVGKDGEPFEVAATLDARPDGSSPP